MRVAVVSVHGCPEVHLGYRDTGGMNAVLLQTTTRLGELGVSIDIFTRMHDSELPLIVKLASNVTVIHLTTAVNLVDKEQIYHETEHFIDEINLYKESCNLSYDVLHIHYWLSSAIGIGLSKRWKVPLVAQFHTLADTKGKSMAQVSDPLLRKNVERNLIQHADRILVASSDEMASIEQMHSQADIKLEMVPYGVDTTMFYPLNISVARFRLGLNGDPLILYAGRIDPIKGIDLLLQGVACMKIRKNAELIVIGGGEIQCDQYLDYLQELSYQLGIDRRVHFVEAVDQKLLMYYYNAADVCVIPSRYESFGLVALEAMACGTPVIARKVGGLQSLVKHGMTGYLVPWHCPEPLANQLEILLDNDLLRKKMGDQAELWAKTWTWESTAEQLSDVYQKVVAESVQ